MTLVRRSEVLTAHPNEAHSPKRRAASATRPVPVPPQFVLLLRAHIDRFGVAPDGRLFRNQKGNYVDAAAYDATWARATGVRSDPHETRLWAGQATLRSPARRDLVLALLRCGAGCARRAGQSIEVLFRHYAKFLDGVREQANRLIERANQAVA
ncbi:hypothetical protein GCM10010377_17790 [Streptomyces viridiviolaceus]|nr:hypothetical protein GCM10010377_17790 [Streptomyces viridiviolaceus]